MASSDWIEQTLNQQKKYEVEKNRVKAELKANEPSVIDKVLTTMLDMGTETVGFLSKGVEGVVDTGVGLIGKVGGVFGADTDWAEDFIKKDYTQDLYYNWEEEVTKNSYLNDAPVVKNIVRGIGQQLPAIGLSFIPGVGPWLGMGYSIASSTGLSTEEALNDGADFDNALLYGVIQGGIEGIGEYLTRGMSKGITSVFKASGKTLGKTNAKSAGKIALEEGIAESIQEGTSALVNPITQMVYKGSDALNAYNNANFYQNVLEQVLVGGAVGGVLGGGTAKIQQYRLGGKDNFSVAQSKAEIDALDKKEYNLWKNDNLTSNKSTQINNQRKAELENISNHLKSLNEEDRAETISKFNLQNQFTEKGEYVIDVADNETLKTRLKANSEAYSPSLKNKKLLFEPTNEPLTEDVKSAKKIITTINPGANMVISDNLGTEVNAFYDTKSKVFYFSKEATTRDIVGHEFTHSLEGTKAYESLANYVLSNVKNLEEKIQHKIAEYSRVNKDAKQGENGENIALYEAQTEIVADEMGRLLTDQKSVERIVNQNKSVALKIIQWIKDVLAKFTKKGIKGEYYNYLRNAEKLYANAVKNSIGGISLSDVEAYNELEKLTEQKTNTQTIANFEEKSYSYRGNKVRYNIKSNYSQYQTTAMIWANETKTMAGDLKVLYNPKTDTFNLLEADGNGEFVVLKQSKNYEIVEDLFEEIINEQGSDFEFNESINKFEESVGRSNNLDLWGIENNEASNATSRQVKRKSEYDRVGNSKTNNGNNENEIRYNINGKIRKYLSYNKVGIDNVNYIRNEINKLYSGVKDGIADGIAIEKGEDVYIVDTGKDEGNVSFGIRKVLVLSDEQYRKSLIKEINNDAVSKGYVSDEISSKLRSEYYNNRGSNGRQEPREKLSSNSAKSSDNKTGVFEDNGDRGGRVLRYSINEDKSLDKEKSVSYNDDKGGIYERRGSTLSTDDNSVHRWGLSNDDARTGRNLHEAVQGEAGERKESKREPKLPVDNIRRFKDHSKLTRTDENFVIDLVKEAGFKPIFYEPEIKPMFHVVDKNLLIPVGATTQQIGVLLDKIKPYKNNVDYGNPKTAHISDGRWERSIKMFPNAYVCNMKIEDFLNLSADRLVQRYLYNESSELDVDEIKDINYPLYLMVDFDKKITLSHEGRHRMNALLKAGYTHADVFLVPNKEVDTDSIYRMFEDVNEGLPEAFGSITLQGQSSSDSVETPRKVTLTNVVKATSKKYEDYVGSKFKTIYNNELRYSLNNTVEQDVLKEYGKTHNWNETGYILTDGSRLDMSGRNNGAPGGYRTVDHREIFGEDSGTESMIEFMSRGNIRVIPEYPGINLQVEPNVEQYNQIRQLIETLGWKNKEFMIDFDNAKGETVESLSYEGGNVRANQIISDIRYYFKEGKLPYKSELLQFRYSLKNNGYSENQYNNFGWVRANDVLNVREFKDFESKFASAKNGVKYNKSINNEFIIPICDTKDDLYGVDNVLVFAKGTLTSPRISKIIRINLDNETVLSIAREIIYDNESIGVQTENSSIFKVYASTNISYNEYIKNRERLSNNDTTNNGSKNGKGSGEETKRYSITENRNGEYNYSKGQIAKYVADHSKLKVYSKQDTEKVVDNIISDFLVFGDKYGELKGKSRETIIETLWHALNTKPKGYRMGTALDIADYIVKNSVVKDLYDNPKTEEYILIVDTLKNYLHKINLDAIKNEITYYYDKDKSPFALWGKRRGERGSSPDVIKMELDAKGITLNADTPQDIFIEIHELYKASLKEIKNQTKFKIQDILGEVKLEELKKSIAFEILNAYDKSGKKSTFSGLIEKYTNKIDNQKQLIINIKAYNKAKDSLEATINSLRSNFIDNPPANWKIPEEIGYIVRDICKIKTWRNNISPKAREYVRNLRDNLNVLLDEAQLEIYPFKEEMDALCSANKKEQVMSAEELFSLERIFRHLRGVLKNYDKVVFNGKTQSLTELASKGIEETVVNSKYLKNVDSKLKTIANKVYTNPYTRFVKYGGYDNDSIMGQIYNDIFEGEHKRADFVKKAHDLFQEFLKENKNYIKSLHKEIEVNGAKMTKGQAFSVYCTSLRQQGVSHLFSNGEVHLLNDKYSMSGDSVKAFAKGINIEISKDVVDAIENFMSDTDKKYLSIIDEFFNKLSKQSKKATDEALHGISNVEEGYYFPLSISKDEIYQSVGKDYGTMQYVLEMGINKRVKQGASNTLVIDSIDRVVAKHIQSMSNYYGLAIPLTAYNRIMNKQILSRDGIHITKMSAELKKIDSEYEAFANNLWRDLQGLNDRQKGVIDKSLDAVRLAGSMSALGVNLKSISTQPLGLVSAFSELKASHIIKGFSVFGKNKEQNYKELEQYAPLMWERVQSGFSVDAQEIKEVSKELGGKLGVIGTKLGKLNSAIALGPMSYLDKEVIRVLWKASQYDIAERLGKGYEVGTESNKIEAGKRLEKIILTTQSTTNTLGRSEWFRSQNWIVKFARMFTSDAVQVLSKLTHAIGEYRVLLAKTKESDINVAGEAKLKLIEAKKKLTKASTAFVLNNMIYVAIALAFRWLKDGGDEEKDWNEEIKKEVFGTTISLLPFGGDIYQIISGYEPSNMAYTALYNTVQIGIDLKDSIGKIVKGDYTSNIEWNAVIRKTALSISQLYGIPLRNAETYIKSIIGKISPATREEWESNFKVKSTSVYMRKINNAIDNGDEETANKIINIMLNNRTGKINSDRLLGTVRELLNKGYDVLPRIINKTITYNGEKITLTNNQYKQFEIIYKNANKSVTNLVELYQFKSLKEEGQAKAIKYVYDYYYNVAITETLGEESDSKTLLFAEALPIDKLALVVGKQQGLTGDRKSILRYFVNTLKLTANQKYMLMGYLGYSNKCGESGVKAYINTLNLTTNQKTLLLKASGY